MADFAWNGEQYAKKNRFQRRWYKLMMVLASIVVFCTTYALILPAITMEQQCQIPEHQHTVECYTQVTTRQCREFACQWDNAETTIHQHDSFCYDESGELRCELPEVEEHIHDESCYEQVLVSEGHTHSETCYTQNRGERICQAHTHTDDCYQSERTLICTEQEREGHTHGEGCFDEEGNLICELPEDPGHSHGEACFETDTRLICGYDSDHVHTEDCYSWETVCICNQEECEPVYGEPEQICTKPEVIFHAHDESCYDETGTIICGKEQILRHQHDETCWQTAEKPADIESLTCKQEEGENHTHTALCYGTWELTCGMEEHLHGEACLPTGNLMAISDDGETEEPETTAATEAEETTPLKLNPTSAVLYYKKKDSENWIQINGNEESIPGDASFRLQVGFTVKIDDLKAAGYQMVYSPLPDWFRNVSDSTDILDSNNRSVGTMTVNGSTVLLTFNKDWTGLNQETMTGSFYVEAEADLSSITDPDNTTIVVGDTTITVNFDGDLVAKYGEVTLEKTRVSLEENAEDGYDYITYTLKVTAGADGCPGVKVEDSFTSGSQYVESYILPEDVTPSTENGKLTWTIGNMEPNTTETLTYKVKLAQNYLGAKPKNETLTNVATVYSKNHSRTTASDIFTPKGTATMSKIAANFEPNESGGTIRYTVWVHADKSNTYTLENVTIWDGLDGAVDGSYKTEDKFLEYISYNEDSFAYYIGGSKEQNGPGDLQPTETTQKPVFAENKKSFRYNVGNLAPGESRLLIYEVTVDAGVFTQSNEDFQINNRAYIITDPNRSDGDGEKLESYKQERKITTKKWARKLLGDKVTSEMTIDTDEGSFTVPVGSYQYQVVVNETGDWDVSSAVMQDDLNSSHMAYVGYLRVDAYRVTTSTNYGSDQAAAEALERLTPEQTAWVNIDGGKSFKFTPKEIGLPEGNYAYLLTYYAQPRNMDGYSTVLVANQFDLTGTVGINGNIYKLGGIHVSASVQLEGNNHFGAQKRFWYYDASAVGQEHGTMYWVLKLSGSTIPKDTMLLDSIAESPHKVGQVERAFIADSNLEFSEDQTLANLAGTDFTGYTSQTTDSGLELTLTNNVELNGQCLYFIVSTYPTSVPTENGKSQVYKNSLSTKDPGEGTDWVQVSEDQTYVVAGDNLYKSMAEVFEVTVGDTAADITYVSGDADTVLQKDQLNNSGDGLYVAWLVTVNEDSSLSGRYRITETIPAGMEVTYIQQYSSPGYGTRPRFVDQDEIAGYTKTTKEYSKSYDQNPITAYYYTKGQEVLWDVDGLAADPANPGSKKVVFLVVCKVTDSNLFLSGQEKTYVNQVTLSDTAGNEIGKGSADVTLQKPTLSKTGTYDKNVNHGRYPFQIRLNELGIDLVPGANTIKLIDEMCAVLILDPNSIKVVNTTTGNEVDFTAALVDHTLTLTLPDDQPLTITYEAAINAAPGQQIAIINNAHWEGYTTSPGGSVSVPEFSYSAGATVDTATNPVLTVAKADQYDTGQKLTGAVFTLTEMEWRDGQFVEKSYGLSLTGTTDENGKIVFGAGDYKLQCNVPYRLVETKAPEGYVQDSTPQYFVFARIVDDKYPEVLESYKTAGAYILYSTSYTHTALNHKGEILVEKAFQNADGSTLGKIDGTYTFGLFEKGSNDYLQTATVKWANGTVTPSDGKAHFTNVTLGKTYIVCELDDSGQPISAGESGTVSGIPFIVSYGSNEVNVTAENPTGTVTVTNRINYPELPNTGGAGTNLYTVAGAALITAALRLLYNQRKRRREGS